MSTEHVQQRPYRGSRVSSFYPIKSLPLLSSLDSAFQLQEYISLLIRLDVHDVDTIIALPGKLAQKDNDETLDAPELDTKKSEDTDRKSDISVDRACWIYEQLRRLAQDLSHPLIAMLQQECTRSSCPQMKAGEWLYLCVAHGNDGAMEQCCAIDYILHTVDSATALLNSPRAFPSRLSIPQTSHRHFSSLARRLGRIFAHAYFHHREAFEQAEAESSLYARFLKLTSQFDLVPPEFLVIPESATHHDDKTQSEADVASQVVTDSPGRLGRSRTDTMVFSEAFALAEDVSKTEENDRSTGGSLLDSLMVETHPLVSDQSWRDLQTRTEDLDDEDMGDARSELTISGPLSPPVEELSLISLEDTPSVSTSTEIAPALPQSPEREPLSRSPANESSAEEPIQAPDSSEDIALADEPSTSEVAESTSEEVTTATSEASTESTQSLPASEEHVTQPVSENVDLAPLSGDEEPKSAEVDAESELPPPPEQILELREPPPSEPIPPESESDITDEVGGLDGDEGREGGEEEAVVGE